MTTLNDIRKIKALLQQAAPKVKLVMEPIPNLSVDEWEALSQAHHSRVLYNEVAHERS